MKTLLISGVAVSLLCVACGSGTTNSASSIVATTSGSAAESTPPSTLYTSCTGIGAKQCSITLMYNAGGQNGTMVANQTVTAGQSFTLSPAPSACPTGSNATTPCTMTVSVPTTGSSTGNTESITFSLNGQTSNVINLSN